MASLLETIGRAIILWLCFFSQFTVHWQVIAEEQVMAQKRPQRRSKVARTPTKSAGARGARLKFQRRRLIALGMAPAAVEKLNDKEIRQNLRHPTHIAVKTP